VTETREAGWTGTFNLSGGASEAFFATMSRALFLGAVQAALSPSMTKKDTEAMAKTRILSRITQFQDQGVASWGFRVDDEYDSECGIELLGSNLPSVDFEYFDTTHQNLPEYIEVEVAAYWSTPRPSSFTWFGEVSLPPYFNLCQVVVMKIPRHLAKSCHFVVREIAGIGPGQSIHVEPSNPSKDSLEGNTLEGKTYNTEGQDPISVEESMSLILDYCRMNW
jgi:hypothetical protein